MSTAISMAVLSPLSPTTTYRSSSSLPNHLPPRFSTTAASSIFKLSSSGGALVGVWLSAALVGAINSIPLLPKIMELVGLGYTGWFVYRYLLFKVN